MKPTLTFGSLFAGIGGIDLGLERAGMQCAWQVEIDDYATKVLAKHWPDVTRFRDVRTVGKHNLSQVDCIAGGFPCQDISDAGKQAGIEGERSGLWAEFFRIICELRPRYVLVENVAALLHRGMGRVLGDLAACGYDAEWSVLPAALFGAPHLRERVFVVAYSHQSGRQAVLRALAGASREAYAGWPSNHLDTPGDYLQAMEERLCEPAIFRGNNGIPHRVDRLRGLGNAVVPQAAQFVGERIVAAEMTERGIVA